MSEHSDIGNILPLDGKDTDGKPIRGFKISLSRSGWLIYDEPAAREMHKMLAEMIAKWDAPNAEAVPRRGEEQKDCASRHAAMKQDGWKNCWWCHKSLITTDAKGATP